MNKNNKKVMFVSNDGGHFSQMMVLKDLFSEYDSIIVTDNRRAEIIIKEVCPSCEVAIINAAKRKQPKFIKKIYRSIYIKYYLSILFGCIKIWIIYKPKVIISTGSNIAVMMFFIGKLFGSKLVFIETRAKVYTKSNTGKIIEPLCDKIFVQWPEMKDLYPSCEYCGILV